MVRKKHAAMATVIARGKVIVGLVDQEPLVKEFNKQSDKLKTVLFALVDRKNQFLEQIGIMASRANTRISRFLAVSFANADQTAVKAYASDISLGGIFIQTDNPLERGKQFSLNLNVPGLSDPLVLKCEVVWIREESVEKPQKAGMGVKFLDIPEKDGKILQLYIKTIEQMNIEPSPMSEKDTRILEEYLRMVESVSSPA
jgi:uncharacterized protein (TIGR02266 family)